MSTTSGKQAALLSILGSHFSSAQTAALVDAMLGIGSPLVAVSPVPEAKEPPPKPLPELRVGQVWSSNGSGDPGSFLFIVCVEKKYAAVYDLGMSGIVACSADSLEGLAVSGFFGGKARLFASNLAAAICKYGKDAHGVWVDS